jgi:hypothetical protein
MVSLFLSTAGSWLRHRSRLCTAESFILPWCVTEDSGISLRDCIGWQRITER